MTANRLWGGLKVVAGSLELVGAGALLLTPEPTMATTVGGVALGAHGADTVSSGFWQLWTGQEQRTLTDQGATQVALSLGADPETAGNVGTAVDIAVPVAVSLGLGAARLAAVRAGRISLIEHEAVAGSKFGWVGAKRPHPPAPSPNRRGGADLGCRRLECRAPSRRLPPSAPPLRFGEGAGG